VRELVDGIAVVGTGVAGLTLSAALGTHRRPVELVGARMGGLIAHGGATDGAFDRGVHLWPRALAALERIGLLGPLAARGGWIERLRLWSCCGSPSRPVEAPCLRTSDARRRRLDRRRSSRRSVQPPEAVANGLETVGNPSLLSVGNPTDGVWRDGRLWSPSATSFRRRRRSRVIGHPSARAGAMGERSGSLGERRRSLRHGCCFRRRA
jgi:hypothetical protein